MSSLLCKFQKIFRGGEPPRFYVIMLLQVNLLKHSLQALLFHHFIHGLPDKQKLRIYELNSVTSDEYLSVLFLISSSLTP